MYTAQITKDRIKTLCKNKKINMEDMLVECSLGVNAVRQINDTKGMASFSLAKIADALDVSVDYLLGRTDESGTSGIAFTNVGNNNNGNQAIHGNVTVSQPTETDNRDCQLLQMIQNLSAVEYARVVLFIEELKNK